MLIKRPIYDHQLKCCAYEILMQGQDETTEELALQLLQDISASSQLPVFVPYTLQHLLKELDNPITNPVVLKIPAQEKEALSSLDLKKSNVSIAVLIDDLKQVSDFKEAKYIALSPKALQDKTNLPQMTKDCKNNKQKLIGYGLKTPQEFDKCTALFFEYYCGEFIFEPNVDRNTAIASNELTFLELLCLLQEEPCDYQAVTHLIQSDPLLSYQLLRLSNSAIFAGYKAIESIEQAILRLGLMNLKNWAMLLSMQNISKKPIEVLESGLLRAHMAAALASDESDSRAQRAYTAGLLSVLDSLLDRSLNDLLQNINLIDEIKNALLKKEGQMGKLLQLVIAYEEGNWELLETLDYNGQNLSQVYIQCLEKVSQERKALQG